MRYDGAALPDDHRPIDGGANCQRYAYAVLGLFGLSVPPHRSSDLWADPTLTRPALDALQPLDLVLFNATADAYGAHVAVYVTDDQLLHLCHEVGRPAVWSWHDFAVRDRYSVMVGAVRA